MWFCSEQEKATAQLGVERSFFKTSLYRVLMNFPLLRKTHTSLLPLLCRPPLSLLQRTPTRPPGGKPGTMLSSFSVVFLLASLPLVEKCFCLRLTSRLFFHGGILQILWKVHFKPAPASLPSVDATTTRDAAGRGNPTSVTSIDSSGVGTVIFGQHGRCFPFRRQPGVLPTVHRRYSSI